MNKKIYQQFLISACVLASVSSVISAFTITKPVYAITSTTKNRYGKYKKLLALKTDSYQEMTVSQFRENAITFLDTPENMRLLQSAIEDEQLRFHRFNDKNAFFIFNTLIPLAYDNWQKNDISGAVNYRLNSKLHAELEFRTSRKILNPEMMILEYEKVYSGLADTALNFLKAQKTTDLSKKTFTSTSVLEKEAMKKLKKYAAKINQEGNVKINVKKCMYDPEDASFYQ